MIAQTVPSLGALKPRPIQITYERTAFRPVSLASSRYTSATDRRTDRLTDYATSVAIAG